MLLRELSCIFQERNTSSVSHTECMRQSHFNKTGADRGNSVLRQLRADTYKYNFRWTGMYQIPINTMLGLCIKSPPQQWQDNGELWNIVKGSPHLISGKVVAQCRTRLQCKFMLPMCPRWRDIAVVNFLPSHKPGSRVWQPTFCQAKVFVARLWYDIKTIQGTLTDTCCPLWAYRSCTLFLLRPFSISNL